jgi:serine/threonine-protein kinase
MAREVRLARAIAHPNVCQVMSFGRLEDCCFLTMELATGGNLHQELRSRNAPKPWPERLADAKAIVMGLVAVHEAGIVHRDLTPQNILRLSGGRLAITDFGLAVDRPGKTTVVAGTPNYIAPEVLDGGKVSYASDVWQLGVILHEMLYRRRPKWGQTAAGRVLTSLPDAMDETEARSLYELCAACLDDNPDRRPANAGAVAKTLLALVG